MEKKKVRIKEKVTCEILAERLRKMALDLENGRFEIRSGDKTISLSFAESMPIEIEAKQKENKEKLVIEMSWRNLTAPDEGEEEGTLTEPKETMDTVSIESTYGVEVGLHSEEVVDGGSSVAPESVEAMPDTCCNVAPGCMEMGPPSEEALVESSSEVLEPAAATMDADIIESAGGVEPDSLPGEAATESSPEVTEPVAGEIVETKTEAKTRTVRRRR